MQLPSGSAYVPLRTSSTDHGWFFLGKKYAKSSEFGNSEGFSGFIWFVAFPDGPFPISVPAALCKGLGQLCPGQQKGLLGTRLLLWGVSGGELSKDFSVKETLENDLGWFLTGCLETEMRTQQCDLTPPPP